MTRAARSSKQSSSKQRSSKEVLTAYSYQLIPYSYQLTAILPAAHSLREVRCES